MFFFGWAFVFLLFKTSKVPTTPRMTTTITAMYCISGAIVDDGVLSEGVVVPVELDGGSEGGVPERRGSLTCTSNE